MEFFPNFSLDQDGDHPFVWTGVVPYGPLLLLLLSYLSPPQPSSTSTTNPAITFESSSSGSRSASSYSLLSFSFGYVHHLAFVPERFKARDTRLVFPEFFRFSFAQKEEDRRNRGAGGEGERE